MFALVAYYFNRSDTGEWYQNGWRFSSITYFTTKEEAIQALPKDVHKEENFYYEVEENDWDHDEEEDDECFHNTYDTKSGTYSSREYRQSSISSRYEVVTIQPGIPFHPSTTEGEDDGRSFDIKVEINEELSYKVCYPDETFYNYVRKRKEIHDIVYSIINFNFEGERMIYHKNTEKHCIEYLVQYMSSLHTLPNGYKEDISWFLEYVTSEEEKTYQEEVNYLRELAE